MTLIVRGTQYPPPTLLFVHHSQGFFSGVFQMMEGLARIAGPLVASVGVSHRRIFYPSLLGKVMSANGQTAVRLTIT